MRDALIQVAVIRGSSSTSPKPILHDVKPGAEGDYWRLLVPGRYQITASRENYKSLTKTVTVVDGPTRRVSEVVFVVAAVVVVAVIVFILVEMRKGIYPLPEA